VDVKIRDIWYKDDDVHDSEEGQQLWLMPWWLDNKDFIKGSDIEIADER
jgi:hypothetical protein